MCMGGKGRGVICSLGHCHAGGKGGGGGGGVLKMCDTEVRGGWQCLNVTAFLFAVNYGRGRRYWLRKPAEQTFSSSQ